MSIIDILLGKYDSKSYTSKDISKSTIRWEGDKKENLPKTHYHNDPKQFSNHTERDEKQDVGKLYRGFIEIEEEIPTFQVLEDSQQVMVRLSWCRAIYAKLARSGLINEEQKELFNIVSKAIDSVNFYPSGERIIDRAPSLHVDVYGSMSVGDAKKILNEFGTLLFGGCHIKDDYSGYVEVIPTEKEKHTLVRKLIYPYKK